MTLHDQAAAPSRPTEPIRHDNLLIDFTTEFHRIWDSAGSRAKPAAFWRPTPAPDLLPGYFPLGDVLVAGHDNINGSTVVAVVCEADTPSADPARGPALQRPDDFELIWKDTGSKSKRDGAIWRPIPPQGYVAMGSVCSNDHEKPSLNAVRCVRADLVIASDVGELIWNDRGSGAKQNVSVWSATPPAAPAGEIHLAPGSALVCDSYSRPADLPTYSLRIPIPMQIDPRPATPTLPGQAPAREPAEASHCARLPWFAIVDPVLSPLEQLHASPFYRVHRTDQYRLVGQGHNSQTQSKTFRWKAPRVQGDSGLSSFTSITSVEFGGQWQSGPGAPLMFCARLDEDFTHNASHSDEWYNPIALDVIALAPKNRSVAVHLLQSDYRLRRADGSPVTDGFSYTDGNSLHISEYTPEEPQDLLTLAQESAAPIATDSSESIEPVDVVLPEQEFPGTTDSAT